MNDFETINRGCEAEVARDPSPYLTLKPRSLAEAKRDIEHAKRTMTEHERINAEAVAHFHARNTPEGRAILEAGEKFREEENKRLGSRAPVTP